MKKILIILGVILAVVVVGGLIFIGQFKTRALPDYNKDVKLSGLTADVTVIRDSFAIPHIYAENEHDLYLAAGYTMAQDRLWQMDLLRRVTQGRLAEIFGKDLVDADMLFRSLRFTEKSRRIFGKADSNMRTSIESFAEGVNQFIQQAGSKLPPEFGLLGYKPEPWLPEHSLNLIGYMAWDLSTGWPCEVLLDKMLQKLGPDLSKYMVPDMDSVHKTPIYPDFKLDKSAAEALTKLSKTASITDELGLDVFRGSNNWAVAGKKSVTGKPLLANDMHLNLNIPGIWYQMNQVIPGKLNVTGVVLPGQPMVIAGHNDSIAWGFTNVMTDDADFYQETINPNNPDQYLLNGVWKDLKRVEEKILIKGGDSVIRYNRFTHRGPIISELKKVHDKVLSMRWLGNEDSNEVSAVYLLNRASNWTDFRNALRSFVSVNQNAVYADVKGNIGLQSTIGIPIREGDRILVYPGDTDRYDWKGLVPFDQLPYTYNPECGYVASANCKTAPADYPYYISDWYVLPYRMDRIVEMLKEKEKLSAEDFQRMQGDQKSKMAEKFTRYFLSHLVVKTGLSETEKQVYELMRNWDCTLLKERPEGLIFEKWYYLTGINLVKDQMDSLLLTEFIGEKTFFENFLENMLVKPNDTWADDITTKEVTETFGNIIGLSFQQAVKELALEYGTKPDAWKWGDAHTITLAHPMSSVKILNKIFRLNRGPYPVGGSFHTVGPYESPLNKNSGVNHGASERHIFDTGNWDHSLTVILTGTSGIPASKHYCDQTESYVANKYHTDYVTRAKVEGAKLYRMKFTRK
ncbi:MAG: penicillin acylase family protein [Porphyromonadaceae bacterium]|nr:MAG: penicillin acylase family protein [Porphyromonadaceae bacterium]